MKVLLGGCFGNLGREILNELIQSGHTIIGVNRSIKDNVKKFIYTSVIKCDGDPTIPMLEFISKLTKNGKSANIKFGKWTLSNDMTAELKYGQYSFKDYISCLYKNKP